MQQTHLTGQQRRRFFPALRGGCPEFGQFFSFPPVHHQPSPLPEVSRIIEECHLNGRETISRGFVPDAIDDADQRLALGNVVQRLRWLRYPFGTIGRDEMFDFALGRAGEMEAHVRSTSRLPRQSPSSIQLEGVRPAYANRARRWLLNR